MRLDTLASQNTGGAGTDKLTSLGDVENLTGGSGADVLTGSSGTNTLHGGDGNDTLNGTAGVDTVFGDAGDDFLIGGGFNNEAQGGDTLDGGEGFDFASYDDKTTTEAGFTASLLNSAINTGVAAGDTYISIEGLRGGDGDDTLIGDGNSNVLRGGAGNDTLDGGANFDTASWQDTNSAVTVDLRIKIAQNTGQGNDTLINIENLRGGGGNDVLIGDTGNNRLQGRGGNDFLTGGAGGDILDGEDGFDTAVYTQETSAITINLSTGLNGGAAFGDQLISIEAIRATTFNDMLIGDATDNTFYSSAGADYMVGGGGYDTVSFEFATALVTASMYNKVTGVGEAAGDVYYGVEHFVGSNFNDTLVGGGPDSLIEGGLGDDTLTPYAGTAIGGAGADKFVGPWGTVSYVTSTVGLTIDLTNPNNSTGDAKGDTLVVGSVDGKTGVVTEILGSKFNDVMTSSQAAFFRLDGGDGADHLIGGNSAFNYLVGGEGADTLEGKAGAVWNEASYQTSSSGLTVDLSNPGLSTGHAAGDTYISIEIIVGTKFDDVMVNGVDSMSFFGGIGDDKLYAGTGTFVDLDGGPGADEFYGSSWLHYANYISSSYGASQYGTSKEGVTANLSDSTKNTGDAAGDKYFGVEGLKGSDFDDTLTGDNVQNGLVGWSGNDVLSGLNGSDWIYGGFGKDTLIGGSDNDTFNYNLAEEGGDTIVDFVTGDKIAISKQGFGGNLNSLAGTPTGTYFVSAAGHAATVAGHGQFLFDTTTHELYWDIDGTGATAAVLIASFQNNHNVVLADFDLQ